MTRPTREEAEKMKTCLPLALDIGLPGTAVQEILSVFDGYLSLLKDLEAVERESAKLRAEIARLKKGLITLGTPKPGEPLSYPEEADDAQTD